jgi:hypothetical protein
MVEAQRPCKQLRLMVGSMHTMLITCNGSDVLPIRSGPPESPAHESAPPPAYPAHSIPALTRSVFVSIAYVGIGDTLNRRCNSGVTSTAMALGWTHHDTPLGRCSYSPGECPPGAARSTGGCPPPSPAHNWGNACDGASARRTAEMYPCHGQSHTAACSADSIPRPSPTPTPLFHWSGGSRCGCRKHLRVKSSLRHR